MEPNSEVVSAEAQAQKSREDGVDDSRSAMQWADKTETSSPSGKRSEIRKGTKEVMQNIKYIMLAAALGVAAVALIVLVISAVMAKRRRRQYEQCTGAVGGVGGDDSEMRSNYQLVKQEERLGMRTSYLL